MLCQFLNYFDKSEWISIFSALLTVGAIWYAALQLRHAKRSSYASGYLQASLYMQEETFRADRKEVYNLKNIPYENWTDSQKAAAERVCHRFATLAELVIFEVITQKMGFVWHKSVIKCWRIVKPLVEERRKDVEFHDLWKNFEWFALLPTNK